MPDKPLANVAASVRTRLLNAAKDSGRPYDLLLIRYVLERLLYRLSQSPHADRFVLKGAMLLTTWLPHTNRGTRDLDLLGFGDSGDERILGVFRDVMAMEAPDGVVFDVDGLRIDQIREALKYGGVRLRTEARIGGARVPVVIDVGFGDAVEPGLEKIDYPVLLDFPTPALLAYARETVIAEKFQAMVTLGRANTRMKDFYDVWVLSQSHTFDPKRLAQAIAATFARRETDIPVDPPDALTEAFATDDAKRRQWRAFIEDLPDAPPDLADVVAQLAAFLLPPAQAAR